MSLSKTLLIAVPLLISTNLFISEAIAETSFILEQEFSTDKNGHATKYENSFRPEWNYTISENWSMTLIGDLRYDSFANLGPSHDRPENYSDLNGPLAAGNEGSINVKEWFFDGEISESYWRVGKQQVVWGQADGLKILDVVNPQSYREFILDDFEDSRIALWMLNIEIPTSNENSLQLLWIPDTSYNEFAENGTRYQVTSELLTPTLPEDLPLTGFSKSKPNSFFNDSELGIRYSSFINGWDLTLNYLYHYHDSPVLFQSSTLQGVAIESKYKRNHLIGATASNAFGEFTFRAEVGLNSDTFHFARPEISSSENLSKNNGIFQSKEFASVFGLDWQGLEDTMISVQWFQSYLLDYKEDKNIVRDQQTNIASFLYKRTFNNETLTFDFLALHGFSNKDGSLQLKLTYQLQSDIDVWIGTDTFYGAQEGLFGQFSDKDRITLGWKWGF